VGARATDCAEHWLPIYMLALIFDVAASAVGHLGALVAGDDWPE
jgi:hypothetical protein